ncbi:MAG: hypothetical protein HQL40_17310 [Alphaproteobacteria bacterium]|nr:hypothetical protein [Alphaproteobacteria bacterium]
MALSKFHALLICATVLSGCSFTEDALLPSLTGEAPKEPPQRIQVYSAETAAEPQGLLSVTPGQPTGTFVGQKVSTLRGDLQQLQATLARHGGQLQEVRGQTVRDSQQYHGTVAAINTRLQVGTTPGNPVLMQQWYGAQRELDQIGQDILRMNRLATEVGSTSAFAAYLLNSVQAARQLSGAVEEDHRQLSILEDEVNRTLVSIERLLTELSDDANRQQQYVANEKTNLNTLALAIKNGQLYGTSLAATGQQPMAFPPPAAAAPSLAADGALVTIRFDKPNPDYEGKLYSAVKQALDRRPNAMFDVIAVTPSKTATPGQAALGSATTRRNAETVIRSLSTMGLPANRIRLSATTSEKVRAGEVHVYVR